VIPYRGAIAGATLLQQWLPLPNWEIGAVLMAAMTAVNLMSARSYGEFEFWFASIKVAAIIVFIATAAAYAFGLSSPSGPTFANLVSHGGFAPKGVVAVFATVTTVFFSMMGAEIVTIAAAESTEPAKSVARMVSTVVWRILAFYIGSIALIVSIVPWDSNKSGESPFTRALDQMQVPLASTIMSVIILTAVLSCLNSAFYVASRVLFVLAERGDAPRWLVVTNRRHVPARSVLLASVAGFAGVIAAILSPGLVFEWLVKASGALIVFIYMMICLSQVRLRKARERAGAPPAALPMWLFPWLSYLAIAAMVAVLIAMAVTKGQQSELGASVVSIALTLIAYGLLRHGRHRSPP
jgi:L-asparagine transporter-like permease